MSDRIWGLTLDSVENLPRILAVLKALPKRATVRIVCDPGVSAHYYEGPCEAIAQAADILLAPVDSFAMKQYNTHGYVRRFQSYLGVLGKYSKYCEAINEANGDWLGKNVALKATSVLPLIKAAGLKSVMTYYWSENLIEWATRNQIYGDLTLLSYYPNASSCPMVLGQALRFLQSTFLGTVTGISEYGTQDGDGNEGDLTMKQNLVKSIERRPSNDRDCVFGGYWTGYQDLCVSGALLPTFMEVWK